MPEPGAVEHRESERVRKVWPVAFMAPGGQSSRANKTVTANVSRGGMLLVTREDRFPPMGAIVEVEPQMWPKEAAPLLRIPSEIIHTRFSPRSDLFFAGLKFRERLSEELAKSLGLDSETHNVQDALSALRELEALCEDKDGPATIEGPADASALEDEAERLRAAIEDDCEKFFMATRALVADWSERKVMETVLSKEDLSRAKGMKGLGRLKSELRSFIEDIPALVDAQLNRDHLWPHRQMDEGAARDLETPYMDPDSDRPAAPFVEEVRKLFGFAGVMLVRHGYDALEDDSEWTAIAQGGARLEYRGEFAFSPEMIAALKRARESYEMLTRLEGELTRTRKSAGSDEIRAMWDEA